MTLYVGNLDFEVTEQNLTEFISQYATVKSVKLPTDRETGQLKGWAIVDLANPEQEISVISAMDGVEWMRRELKVTKFIKSDRSLAKDKKRSSLQED